MCLLTSTYVPCPMLACSLCLSSQLNKQIKSCKTFKDSPQGRENAVSWPQQGEPESLSEKWTIFLWVGREHPYTSSVQDLPWLNTARQSFSFTEGTKESDAALPEVQEWVCVFGQIRCIYSFYGFSQGSWFYQPVWKTKSKYPVQNCPSGWGHRCLLTWSWSHLGKNTMGVTALSDAQEQSPLYLLPL